MSSRNGLPPWAWDAEDTVTMRPCSFLARLSVSNRDSSTGAKSFAVVVTRTLTLCLTGLLAERGSTTTN